MEIKSCRKRTICFLLLYIYTFRSSEQTFKIREFPQSQPIHNVLTAILAHCVKNVIREIITTATFFCLGSLVLNQFDHDD